MKEENKVIEKILSIIQKNSKSKSFSDLLKDKLKTKVIIGLFSISILIPIMGIIFLLNMSYVTYTSGNLEHLLKEKETTKNRVEFFQNKIPKVYKMINDFEIDKSVLDRYPVDKANQNPFIHDNGYKIIKNLENEQYKNIKEIIKYLDEFNTESAKEVIKNKLENNLDQYKQIIANHLEELEKNINNDKKIIKILQVILIFLIIAMTIISIGISVSIVILVLRDIKQQKESDRMKSEFISTVSHELRTPLTSIYGALGLILSGAAGEISDNAKDLIDIANNNSSRLINLINDILDIEKIEAGKMKFNIDVLEIMSIVEQTIKDNDAYAQKYNVKYELIESLPEAKIKADKDRLIQVITNLLSNAAKFSSKDSSVKISVLRLDKSIRVTVTDKGPGIPEEFQSQIFQKFAQADSSDSRQKGGTGLGLNICKAIIEKMGGNIGFETKINKGATFYFDLPELIENKPEIRHQADSSCILICEDDKDVASFLSILFKQNGYSNDIVYNAEQAKQLLQQHNYDLLTLDLILPDQDGISLIRELREQEKTKNLPIIVVSVKANEGSKELNGDFAIVDWINKPIDQERLFEAIKRSIPYNSKGNPNILHIEDDPDILHITSSILKDVANISQVTSISDAILMLKHNKFDLVILDLELPDGNGLDLLPMINKHSDKKVSTLIFSAHEIDKKISEQVSAVLLKSKASNEDLLGTIKLLTKTNNSVYSDYTI